MLTCTCMSHISDCMTGLESTMASASCRECVVCMCVSNIVHYIHCLLTLLVNS